MLTIHENIEQGTDTWHKLRLGLPTASMFSAILAKGEGKTRKAYMHRLAAEIITGEPTETFKSQAMERGNNMEAEARDLYAFMRDADLTRVGFITNGRKGCSPDSLIGTNRMLEIKTQRGDLLIDTILKGEFPSEHRAQCQGNLWVAEREEIDICVYWPKMAPFIRTARRDEVYIQRLATEVHAFNEELDELVDRIKRMGIAA